MATEAFEAKLKSFAHTELEISVTDGIVSLVSASKVAYWNSNNINKGIKLTIE